MSTSKAERDFDTAKDLWCERLKAQGKKIVSGEEYDMLCDVETLLALACRRMRFAPFNLRTSKESLLALHAEVQTERAHSVAYCSFRMEDKPEPLPDNVILFTPEVK